jgi:hypothetical protein
MKTIRLIIVLALFVCSLALDMSSAKSRVETNAYVSLYSSLGLTEGFKTMFNQPSRGEIPSNIRRNFNQNANYYINVEGANGKVADIGATTPQTQPDFVSQAGAFTFLTREAWNSRFPAWLKSMCTSTSCTIKNIQSISVQTGSDDLWFFQITILNKKTFKIILTNGGLQQLNNQFPHVKMLEIVTKFTIAKVKRTQQFWQQVDSVLNQVAQTIDAVAAIQQTNEKRKTVIKENVAFYQGQLNAHIATKKQLTQTIATLNSAIDAKKQQVSARQTDKSRCWQEFVSINLRIENEQKRIENVKANIATQLAKAQENKTKTLKNIFYWLEASYYYRVFAERLVKDVAALDVATADAAITATQTKIKNAFLPIPIAFATNASK